MIYIVGKLVSDYVVYLGEFGWCLDIESARRFDRTGAELACIMRGGWWVGGRMPERCRLIANS